MLFCGYHRYEMEQKQTNIQKRVLVTGGLGFIGSYFVKLLLDRGYFVINVDKKTYAHRKDLNFDEHSNYELIEEDICRLKELPSRLDHIVNFAAESHVDNSIAATEDFFNSNIRGVHNLLELLRATPKEERPIFTQISTDEVYGDILEGTFTENDRLKPSSPYSATKAAADQLVLGWARTYGIKARITRACNNYGYGQYAEKIIPATIKSTLKGGKVLVHGSGLQKREWVYAGDKAEAVFLVMERGKDGEIYNISTNEEHSVLDIVKMILRELGKPEDHFQFSGDRPGQDLRYAVDSTKIRALGWKPTMTLKEYIPIYIKLCEVGQTVRPQSIRRYFANKVSRIRRRRKI